MAKKSSYNFYISSTKAVSYSGASDFNTDSLNLSDFNGSYVLYLNSDHTTGTPTISMEVSNDGSSWFEYTGETTDIAIPIAISDDEFLPKYLRLAYTANSSDGDITFKLDPIDG